MKITVTTGDAYEGSCETLLETNEGKDSVCFGRGEPEDMCLARDLNDATGVYRLLEMAYRAGKNGEDIEIIHLDEEEQ